jgi:hypothetical protein
MNFARDDQGSWSRPESCFPLNAPNAHQIEARPIRGGEKAVNFHPQEIATKFLRSRFKNLSEHEQRVLHQITQSWHLSRDPNQACDASLTLPQRLADHVTALGGSWTFTILFGTIGEALVCFH